MAADGAVSFQLLRKEEVELRRILSHGEGGGAHTSGGVRRPIVGWVRLARAARDDAAAMGAAATTLTRAVGDFVDAQVTHDHADTLILEAPVTAAALPAVPLAPDRV